MSPRRKNVAFSLIESVIAVFILGYAALSVLSLTQSGFVAQKRNQEIAKANLVAQSVIADLRLWGENIANYKSGWGAYNTTITPAGFPEYRVTVRSKAEGRKIYSPCSELESQWELTKRGWREMPNAIVPVELKITWSDDPRDKLVILTYVGEPKRDITGITYEITGPNPVSLGMGNKAVYRVSAKDSAGRGLDNLLFLWVPDIRYLSITEDAQRDGRYFQVIRDRIVKPPDVAPPAPPSVSPVTCYSRYAGRYLDANPPGIQLP